MVAVFPAEQATQADIIRLYDMHNVDRGSRLAMDAIESFGWWDRIDRFKAAIEFAGDAPEMRDTFGQLSIAGATVEDGPTLTHDEWSAGVMFDVGRFVISVTLDGRCEYDEYTGELTDVVLTGIRDFDVDENYRISASHREWWALALHAINEIRGSIQSGWDGDSVIAADREWHELQSAEACRD